MVKIKKYQDQKKECFLFKLISLNLNGVRSASNKGLEPWLVKQQADCICMQITDDGIGFDVSKKSKGIGMQNMISRAIDCNGKLDINSSKENGTKITLNIPLE